MICCWYSMAASDSPSAVACENTRWRRDPPASAALICSQTPTRLNSINPQRSLAIFAPMLAPSLRLVLQGNDCAMAAYKGGPSPGAPNFDHGGPQSALGPSRPGELQSWAPGVLLTAAADSRSTQNTAWLLNSERLSTLDKPPLPVLMTNQNEKWRRGRAWKSLICSAC